jgi:hypothetical protein
MPRAHLRRRYALPAFAETRLTALAEFGGSGASTAPAATASAYPAANASTVVAEAQALAAYRAAFADRTAVEAPARKAGCQSPQLNQRLSGDAYAQVYNDAFVSTNVNGVSVRGAPVLLRPTVVNSTPSGNPVQIRVADRAQTYTWTPVNAAGKRCTGSPGARQLTFALVSDLGGILKVSDLIMRGPGSC